MTRVAACSCGQMKLTCEGEPVRVSLCHCHGCQLRTGSAFGVLMRFPRGKVTIEGRSTVYTRAGDSGGTADFHFCPTCGATVYWVAAAIPDFISVAYGAFAGEQVPAPNVYVYGERAHSWVLPALAGMEHQT